MTFSSGFCKNHAVVYFFCGLPAKAWKPKGSDISCMNSPSSTKLICLPKRYAWNHSFSLPRHQLGSAKSLTFHIFWHSFLLMKRWPRALQEIRKGGLRAWVFKVYIYLNQNSNYLYYSRYKVIRAAFLHWQFNK